MKPKSEQPSSMLFADVSTPRDKAAEEEDPQTMMTQDMEEATLPMKSPMSQIYRTMSPSLRPGTSSLWDPSHESSIEIEPEQMHSSPSISDT